MRRDSVHFVALLLAMVAGAAARPWLAPPTPAPTDFNIAAHVPYQIGEYHGSDLRNDLQELSRVHNLAPQSLVLREYQDGSHNALELYLQPGAIQWNNCFRGDGWVINFSRDTTLGRHPALRDGTGTAGQGLRAREFVALSPEGEPHEILACISYVKTRRGYLTNPLLVDLESRAGLFGRPETPAVTAQICSNLQAEAQAESAFHRLRPFAVRVDQILEGVVTASGDRAIEPSGDLKRAGDLKSAAQ